MVEIHTYRAFGLTIASHLPLPELVAERGEPALEVTLGDVPPRLSDAVRAGVRFQVAPGRVLVWVDGVARYLAREGGRILVEPEAAAPEDSVRLFLLGPMIAAALHQRGVLALSASAVAVAGGCAVFMGLSGAGKSTLTAGLRARGYRVLADDLCAVTFRDGQPVAHPASPALRLWPNELRRLGLDPGALRRVRPELEKRVVPLGDAFAPEPLPIERLFLLRRSRAAARVAVEPLESHHAVGAIGIHTYGSQFLEGLGTEGAYFDNVSALLAASTVEAIDRPSFPFALDELLDAVERAVRR